MDSSIAKATSDAVQKLLNQGGAYVDARRTELQNTWQSSMDSSLSDLFGSMDSDGDGFISLAEFKSSSPQSWAALHAVSTSLPGVHDMFISAHVFSSEMRNRLQGHFVPRMSQTWGQWFTVYLQLFFLFQVVMCVIEHARYWLGLRCLPKHSRWPKNPNPEKNPPELAPNAEAVSWYDTPIEGWYERSKTALFVASGFALLRFIQGCTFFVIGVLCLNIANVVPSKLWRTFWLFISKWSIYGILFSLGYYKITIHGKFAGPEKTKILLGNHVCLIEVLVMFAETFPSFVSRVENLSIPLFSGIVHAVDGILVDRSDKNSKHHTLDEIRRRAEDPSAPQVMVFPEGTCNNQKVLFRFNRGPFSIGTSVQMALFKFPYRNFNPTYNGRCLGGNELGDILFRCCCQFVNRLEVKVMPVYHPNEAEIADGTMYATKMQHVMGAHLGCKISNATTKEYADALSKFHEAHKKESAPQKGGWKSLRRASTVADSGRNAGNRSHTDQAEGIRKSGTLWTPWTAWASVMQRLKSRSNSSSIAQSKDD